MIITDKAFLQKPCRDVFIIEHPTFTNAVIAQLEEELKNSKVTGIGLAANQIGIDAKICIIRTEQEKINLANPIIVEKYDLSIFKGEGCLSFPGEWLMTKRYNEIVVKDLYHPAGIILMGLEAVVAQHEIGHLYGELMHDYVITLPLGPNSPCWCGSGKKWKKCCTGKEIKQK